MLLQAVGQRGLLTTDRFMITLLVSPKSTHLILDIQAVFVLGYISKAPQKCVYLRNRLIVLLLTKYVQR